LGFSTASQVGSVVVLPNPKIIILTKKNLWRNVKDCAISLKAGKDVSKAPISC
jgi:hypothetical protein